MKVFLTGASGGIGKRLVKNLDRNQIPTVKLSRKAINKSQWHQGDIIDPTSYRKALAETDTVIHLAAITHSNDALQYDAINTEGTRILLDECQKANVKRFIYISTTAVGKECGAYGHSKHKAEELVRQSSLEWTILRLGEVYGAASSEAISQLIENVKSKALIPYPYGAKTLLAPVHIDDIIPAIINSLPIQHSRSTHILAGPETMKYSQLIRTIHRSLNKRGFPIPIPTQIIQLASNFFAFFCSSPPIVTDQVQRLLCEKNREIASSTIELGFRPRSIEDYLEATQSHKRP